LKSIQLLLKKDIKIKKKYKNNNKSVLTYEVWNKDLEVLKSLPDNIVEVNNKKYYVFYKKGKSNANQNND
jgi:L-lysine 2,3-aminomutase